MPDTKGIVERVAEIINHNCISVNQDVKYTIQVKIAASEIERMVEEIIPECDILLGADMYTEGYRQGFECAVAKIRKSLGGE